MGARVARMFRNFNLENRVLREISKEKPQAAPRHAVTSPPPSTSSSSSSGSSEGADAVGQRSDPLLDNLRSVFVESTDPGAPPPPPPSSSSSSSSSAAAAAAQVSKTVTESQEVERRPLKYSIPLDTHGLVELTDVPKGKLTITEALKALSSHQREPQTWTADKVAQDYSLDLKDTKALLEFFIPFQVKIIPPKTDAKQIKAS